MLSSLSLSPHARARTVVLHADSGKLESYSATIAICIATHTSSRSYAEKAFPEACGHCSSLSMEVEFMLEGRHRLQGQA